MTRECRIESPALQAAESINASDRITQSENRLVDSIERMINQAFKRRGSNRSVKLTHKQREDCKIGLRQRVAIAREL